MFFRRLGIGVVVCAVASLAQAEPPGAGEGSTLERELAAARGADRVPLLLELAELQRDEPAAVLDFTQQVLALLRESASPPDETRARIARSHALQARGEYPAALAEAQHAERLAGATKRRDLIARAAYQHGQVQWRMARYADALAKAEEAQALQAAEGPSLELARTLSLIAAIHQSLGNYEGAIEQDLRALRMSEALGDERGVARSLNNIGVVHWDLGRFQDAEISLRRALEIQERIGPRDGLANTLANVGLVLVEQDRPAEALPFLERAYGIDVEAGDLYGQAKSFSNLGYAYEKLAEPERAFEFHQRALSLRERIGDKDGIVRTTSVLAGLRLERGEVEPVIAMLERALALAVEINERRDEAALLEVLSRAREAKGDVAGALAAFRRYHEIEAELAGSETNQRVAAHEARDREEAHARELAAAEALAASRREKLEWLIAGSVVLAASLALLAALFVSRLRSGRALAESERRYRLLFQTSVVPTLLVERDGRAVVDLNAPARELCGALPASGRIELEGLEPEWVRAALARLFGEENGEQIALDDCCVESSGRLRWTELRGSAVAVGGRACWLVSLRDTTALREQEETREREGRLEALGVLAGGIAHDFNNALAAIIGNVSLAKDGSPAERSLLLDLAEQAASEARQLTAQLLAFAKGGVPARRVLAIGPLLREAVALAGAGSRMKIELEVPDELWFASVDRGQFNQVVSNLVINAQQATPEGGLLCVRASNLAGGPGNGAGADGRPHVRIDFEDNGVGIPHDIRGRVFDPYFTTKPGGSGLGLATAFAICRKHGGTLTLESRPGSGTTFSIFLPAVDATASQPEVPEPEREPPGGGRVLVLEDEPRVQHVLRRMLERWGFTVEIASDGKIAVERYLERRESGAPFELLIMDLTIPGGMGGRAALAEIHKHDPGARAIVASGYSDDPAIAHFRAAGFAAALAKPFRQSDLARAVNAALRFEAAQSELAEGDGGSPSS